MEKVILEGYTRYEFSVYSELKNSLYWSFMHDGIRQFWSELNGLYIWDIYIYIYYIIGWLYILYNRLASHLNDEIVDILEVQGSAFETLVSEVSKYVKYKIFSIPPNKFKLGKLKKIDTEEKTIKIETSIRFQLVTVEMV